MEAIGLTVSIVSLASLFETALDCFQYIQLGKNFGSDFQTSSLQLDNTQLRLSRWGQALGLGTDAGELAPLAKSYPAQDVSRAEALLGQIINLFQQAEEVSSKFKAEQGDAGVTEIQEVLTAHSLPLHQKIHNICLSRQKKTSSSKKAKWALYERKHFNDLVNDTRTLVNDLVELFPSTIQMQIQLCDQEAITMQNEAALPELKEIAAKQDKILEEAITRLSAPDSRTTYNTWNNRDSTKVLNQGDNITYHGNQSFSF